MTSILLVFIENSLLWQLKAHIKCLIFLLMDH